MSMVLMPCRFVLFLTFFLPAWCWAAPTLVLGPDGNNYPLGLYLDLLEDRDRVLAIDDVSSPSASLLFIPSEAQAPNFGFTRSAWWGRFTVRNTSGAMKSWLLHLDYSVLDRIELFLPDANGGFEVKEGGRSVAFPSWEFARRNCLFRLPIEAGEEKTFYIRTTSESSVFLPLSIWAEDAFAAADQAEHLKLGLFYGVVLAMGLYNFFLFLSLRDRTYLFYVLYVFFFGLDLFIVDGLALQHLWPGWLAWNRQADLFFGFLVIFWAVAFSRRFLGTRTVTLVADRLLAALQWSSGLVAVPLLFVSYVHSVKVLIVLAALYVPALMGSALVCMRRGFKGARLFVVAWGWSVAGILLLVLVNFLTLSNFHVYFWVAKGFFGLELVFLSLALADRINWLQAEKHRILDENLFLVEETSRHQAEKIQKEQRFLREKQRMIKELHDGIGGATSNIHLLAELAQRCPGEEEVRRTLSVISTLSRSSVEEIRNFMQSIDERELNWQSLMAEIASHGYNVTEPHGVAFSFNAANVAVDVAPPCSILWFNLHRIYKEALTNIIKHAAAKNVAVTISIGGGTVSLVIQDDGVGFSGSAGKGRGLAHMAARAEELGGSFTILPEKGTKLRVVIPIPLKYPAEGIVG
jgi:two-component system, sensor histidine kinase LadS